MTGFLTGPALEAVLAVRHADLVRHRVGFGFALVEVNRVDDLDQDGPGATDEVIRLVAARLRPSTCDGDVLGNWARGVFGIVVGHADQPRLAGFGTRLANAFGVVSAPDGAESVHARIVVMRSASEALG